MVVKQIVNLFKLMDLFARMRQPLSVKDIVEEFGWARSSVFNMVSTMVDEGYLYQPTPRGGYFPTTRWMELARELTDAQPIPAAVHELLLELASETGETLFLAAAEGTSIVFLDVVESAADIRFIANVGQRLPIHVTAAGRAILSQYDDVERAATLRRIRYQAYEKARFMAPEAVEQDIATASRRGWFSNLGYYAPGVAGVAVPFTFRGRRDAIALGGPVSRIEPKIEAIGTRLKAAIADFLKSHP